MQLFLTYGLSSRSSLASIAVETKNKGINLANEKSELFVSRRSERVPYRPPHLRRREVPNTCLPIAESASDCGFSTLNSFSSDSEHSDNDATPLDGDPYCSSKARLAAILCIQVYLFIESFSTFSFLNKNFSFLLLSSFIQ